MRLPAFCAALMAELPAAPAPITTRSYACSVIVSPFVYLVMAVVSEPAASYRNGPAGRQARHKWQQPLLGLYRSSRRSERRWFPCVPSVPPLYRRQYRLSSVFRLLVNRGARASRPSRRDQAWNAAYPSMKTYPLSGLRLLPTATWPAIRPVGRNWR